MGPEDTFRLPGYEILEKAGEGGMATVWIARQVSLDRIVAIKTLSTDLVRNSEAMERFRFEAQAAAKLSYSGIVRVHDFGEHAGTAYYVMEYVAGCTIGELLKLKGRLPERTAVAVAEGVGMALRHAWEKAHLIHCDIKPENVMIERDGTIKLADLGLAQIAGMVHERGETVLGTPNYISPEQARGDRELDCRADIYSLGAMLYHMLTGQIPFAGNTAAQVLEKQAYGFLPDPQQLNPDISSGAAWLMEKMMIKDRTLRPSDWNEVLVDIDEVKEGRVPLGKMPSSGHSTVLRSEVRQQEPSATQQIVLPPDVAAKKAKAKAKAKKKGGSSVLVPAKQKIVLPKEVRRELRGRSAVPKRTSEVPQVFMLLGGLLLLVCAGYGVLTLLMKMPEESRSATEADLGDSLPPRSFVSSKDRPIERKFTPASRQSSSYKNSSRRTAKPVTPTRVKWDHPRFIEGAEAFNLALKQYKQYHANRKDPQVLDEVEQGCRKALAAFEACEKDAPPAVDMDHFKQQCYQLISDCRQSMIMVPSKKRTASSRATGSRKARSKVEAHRAEREGLVLAPSWDAPGNVTSRTMEDLSSLLQSHGEANLDLAPDDSLRITGNITYLMPLKQVCDLYGARAQSRKNVNVEGFPKNSFFHYTIEGKFGDGFGKMVLVADRTDQVVAVQLVDPSPIDELWLEPHLYSEQWSTYDFVQGRTKGSSKWRIAHKVHDMGDVVQIDSELVTHDAQGYFGLGRPKARVSLFLPRPIVNLLLYRIEHIKG